jgi:hypothetical protein
MVGCYLMLTAAPEVVPGLDSRTVALLLGVTYRQLDYAIRCVDRLGQLPTMLGGSGSRRRFTAETLRRLDVAARLADADPGMVGHAGGRAGYWQRAVAGVMAGPTPPPAGFALLDPDGDVHYRTTLRVADFPVGPIGGIVRYDLTATPLGKWLADHDVPPPEPSW